MQRLLLLWIIALVGLLSLSYRDQAHAASWVITMRNSQGVTTFSVDERLGAKMVIDSQPGVVIISRTDQQRVYQVDETQGIYTAMDWMELRNHRQKASLMMQNMMQNLTPEQRAAMQQHMAQLRQQMQHMPPEQRAQMERMMQQYRGGAPGTTPASPVKIDYYKTGKHQTINGFNTWQVIKYKNGRQDQELWVAAVQDWQRIAQAWKHAFQAINEDQEAFAFAQIGGLPIRMIGQDVTNVLSIASTTLTPADLSPSKNARQVKPMEIGPMRR
jgi:hypothetical protein